MPNETAIVPANVNDPDGASSDRRWDPKRVSPKGLKRPPVHKRTTKKRRNDPYAVANRRGGAFRDKALREFESQAGRERILDALLIAQDEDPRILKLVHLMLAPRHKRTTFAHLTSMVGISLGDFLDLSRRAYKKLGIAASAHHLPAIINDIALDSYSTKRSCWQCDGAGTITPPQDPDVTEPPVPAICQVCDGTGLVRQPGDKDARQTFLEIEGVISRKGGIEITNNVAVAGAGAFESIIARRDQAMDMTPDRGD